VGGVENGFRLPANRWVASPAGGLDRADVRAYDLVIVRAPP
jgi:hypothetical protein